MKEKYNHIYETAMEEEDFESVLPDTYEHIKGDILWSGWIEDDLNHIFSCCKDDDLDIDETRERLEKYSLYDVMVHGGVSGFEPTHGIESNDDFRQFLKWYIKKNDLCISDLTNDDGSLDWNSLMKKTNIEQDVFQPLYLNIANDWEILEQTENYIESLIDEMQNEEDEEL